MAHKPTLLPKPKNYFATILLAGITLLGHSSAVRIAAEAGAASTAQIAHAAAGATEVHDHEHIIPKMGCTADLHGNYFNLMPLSKPLNEENRKQSEMYEVDFDTTAGKSNIQFNICQSTARHCPDEREDYANIVNQHGTCNHMSRDAATENVGRYQLISQTMPELGLKITYSQGNICNEETGEKYSLELQLNCNPNLKQVTYAIDEESLATPCSPKIIMNTPDACPVIQTGPLSEFIDLYGKWVALPMILIGVFSVFFSGRYPKTSMFLFTTICLSLGLLVSLYSWVLPGITPVWSVWIVGTICLGSGAGLGVGAARWPRIGVFTLGLAFGAIMGQVIHVFVASNFATKQSSLVLVRWLVVLIAMVNCAIVCLLLFDYALVLAGCVFGSYFVIRGISVFFGGYPNEFELIMAAQNGEVKLWPWTVWFYFALMVLTAGAGAFLQLRDRKKHLEQYEYKGRFSVAYLDLKTLKKDKANTGFAFGKNAQAAGRLGTLSEGEESDGGDTESRETINRDKEA